MKMFPALGRCGYLAPLGCVARPMLASCRTRLLRRPQACAVRRLGSPIAIPSPVSLVIFHRHGDRSPLRGHTPDEELALKAPAPAASAALAEEAAAGGSARASGAFGRASGAAAGHDDGEASSSKVATTTGANTNASTAEKFWRGQLVPPEDIRRLDELYPVRCSPGEAAPPDQESAPFGCLTSLGLQQLRQRGDRFRRQFSVDGIDTAKMAVFSTNYRRTQLSAQGFLDGFLGGRGGVPVVVRPRAKDFLNQWESRGHVMYERMKVVESGPYFQETEEAIGGPLKRKLHALDPALFPLPQDGRFRWMMAADYFMSARARGLRISPQLDTLGTATIRHLVWRFGRFYRDEEMIRTMAGPLLAHVLECATGSSCTPDESLKTDSRNTTAAVTSGTISRTDRGNGGRLSRVVSSSCHDVTVLALLYAVEAHLIEDEDYWPPYGSTIAFTVSKSREAEAGDTERLVMDISIDGEPLRSRLFRGKGDDDGAGAVSLSDFRTAIRNLLPPPPP